jgi:hypothetical protein
MEDGSGEMEDGKWKMEDGAVVTVENSRCDL